MKNRSLDHIIDTETDLKAACLLKDAVKRSPTGFLTAKSVADWQKLLGLTVPVLRFLRRCFALFIPLPLHSPPPPNGLLVQYLITHYAILSLFLDSVLASYVGIIEMGFMQ